MLFIFARAALNWDGFKDKQSGRRLHICIHSSRSEKNKSTTVQQSVNEPNHKFLYNVTIVVIKIHRLGVKNNCFLLKAHDIYFKLCILWRQVTQREEEFKTIPLRLLRCSFTIFHSGKNFLLNSFEWGILFFGRTNSAGKSRDNEMWTTWIWHYFPFGNCCVTRCEEFTFKFVIATSTGVRVVSSFRFNSFLPIKFHPFHLTTQRRRHILLFPVVLHIVFTHLLSVKTTEKNSLCNFPPTASCTSHVLKKVICWNGKMIIFWLNFVRTQTVSMFTVICYIIEEFFTRNCWGNSPSLFMPMVMHFLSRQAWHWFRCALSTIHRPVPAWHL